MSMDVDIQRCQRLIGDSVNIMAQASIFLPGQPGTAVDIHRGMLVISLDGQEAGRVGGVAVSRDEGQALCLILSHLPEAAGYQSLPVCWIARVAGEIITLNTSLARIESLPDWHAA